MTDDQAAGAQLHHAYVAAINSNDIDRMMALLADDVVFQVSGEPELVGHDAVREWGASFFEAFEARYDKQQTDFGLSGDLAFARYTYTARFVGREDGAVIGETGKGTTVFRRQADGPWLLIIDSWSRDAGSQ